ncbi:unnamed protein product, partial [Prunus brigantina]
MEVEVMLGIPAEKAWEIYRDNDIINKINPEMLTSAKYIEGDGCRGSLRLFKLGPVTLSVSVFQSSETKLHEIAISFVDDDHYVRMNLFVHLSPDHPIPPISRMWHEQSDICNLKSKLKSNISFSENFEVIWVCDGGEI